VKKANKKNKKPTNVISLRKAETIDLDQRFDEWLAEREMRLLSLSEALDGEINELYPILTRESQEALTAASDLLDNFHETIRTRLQSRGWKFGPGGWTTQEKVKEA
jgi:hypothetical protein